MLNIVQINKIYKPRHAPQVHALKNINITIQKSEFVAIVGESGSGKSTLLNILGGLDSANSGNLLINNKDYSTPSSKLTNDYLANYRRDVVGFVFQEFNLISHMSVTENVALALATFKFSADEKQRRISNAIEQVGLTLRAKNKACELSGGQKQRVAIARALVKGPNIILADEPTGALDSQTSKEILALFKALSKQGKLVILVTHDLEVAATAHRRIRLHDGQVVEDTGVESHLQTKNIEQYSQSALVTDSKSQTLTGARAFTLQAVFALSYRRIVQKRWRYLMISTGISVGIAGLILAQTLGVGVEKYLMTSSDQIVDSRKVTITQKDKNFDNNIIFALKKTGATQLIQAEHPLQARFDGNKASEYFAIRPLHREKYQKIYATPIVIAGKLPAANTKGIALPSAIAQKVFGLNINSLDKVIGKTLPLKIMSPDNITHYPSRWDKQHLTITGIIKPSFIGEDYAYVPYEDHIEITKRSRFLANSAQIPTNAYHAYLKDNTMVPAFSSQFSTHYEIITANNVLKNISTMFSQIQLAIYSVSALLLLICGIMAGILFFISVLERQKEIGIFKALGGNTSDVKWILFSEALLVGCIAALLGTLISVTVTLMFQALILEKFGFALLKFNLQAIILGSLFGLAITTFSAIQPANNAARLDPIKLLRKD